MSYSRRTVTDGSTVMNKDLYDNLQDGIDETMEEIQSLKEAIQTLREEVLPETVKSVVLKDILVIE